MNGKIKAVFIGDEEKAIYHPMGKVQGQIEETLESIVDLTILKEYEPLLKSGIESYQVFINYVDQWEKPVKADIIAGILKYVAAGGGLIILHTGISYQNAPEYAQLAGAFFTGHPPAEELTFENRNPEHFIMKDIEKFIVKDEPYRFEIDPLRKSTLLMNYCQDGVEYPAAWTHEYGLGRVVYLMPGHDEKALEIEEYREILRRSVVWVAREDT